MTVGPASIPETGLLPRLTRELRQPLFRNGHALVLSSAATSIIGVAFWVLVARRYRADVVGRDSAAISALMLLGGVAQLNLLSTLTRFVPTSGRGTSRFVGGVYAVATVVSLLLASGFVILAPLWIPALRFLSADRWIAVAFVLGTVAWAVFVLEDGALTGLRRTPWVPVENAGFSLAKIGIVLPLAAVLPTSGILVAWVVATVATVIPTNAFIFGRAIAAHERDLDLPNRVTLAEIRGFAPFDFAASLLWLLLTSALPLVIIRHSGARASAFFSLAWVIAFGLHLVSINMSASFVVESAVDQRGLEVRYRQMLTHLAALVLPATAVVIGLAPQILGVFGGEYAAGGATTLRLLAASAVPFMVIGTAVGAMRARRRTRTVFAVNALTFLIVATGVVVLLPRYGIAGAAASWLVGQTVTALAVAATAKLWLGPAAILGPRGARTPLTLDLARVVAGRPVPAWASGVLALRRQRRAEDTLAEVIPVVATHLRLSGALGRSEELGHVESVQTVSDMTVAVVHSAAAVPVMVVKIPTSPHARRDMRRQEVVLDLLRSDARLRGWRWLLPEMQLIELPDGPVNFEQVKGPCDMAHVLLEEPERSTRLAEAGIRPILELHRRTTQTVRVDDDQVDHWIAAQLDVLRHAHPARHVPQYQLDALDRIEEHLRGELTGQELPVSWVHGDYTPGNVIMGLDRSTVSGIVDWCQARPDGLAALDILLWAAAVECCLRKRQFGTVMANTLHAAVWPGEERLLALVGGTCNDAGLSRRTLALWCWLEHAAGNITKSERFVRHAWWWAANVEPVLSAMSG